MPVKRAYLNAHIPTAQRATIISLDSMFANAGGVIGQSGWGWLARVRSIGEAWAFAGTTLPLGLPLYWVARRNDQRLDHLPAVARQRRRDASSLPPPPFPAAGPRALAVG